MNISDANIILTGGAGEIGSSLIGELYGEVNGFFLVDQSVARLDILKNEFEEIATYKCDLTNEEATDKLFSDFYSLDDSPNVLINNAGLISSGPLVNLLSKESPRLDYSAWDSVIKSNLYTTFLATRAFAHEMIKKRRKGVVINISSISAGGNAGQSAYSAAKSGIESLSKVWCKELSAFGIRTCCIAPGFFDTKSTHEALSENQINSWKKKTPSRRLGLVKELANAIEFIIENDFYNGRILELDGGLDL